MADDQLRRMLADARRAAYPDPVRYCTPCSFDAGRRWRNMRDSSMATRAEIVRAAVERGAITPGQAYVTATGETFRGVSSVPADPSEAGTLSDVTPDNATLKVTHATHVVTEADGSSYFVCKRCFARGATSMGDARPAGAGTWPRAVTVAEFFDGVRDG